jgi:hypothetical protein
MPIINGRYITNVPDSGVYGGDLIKEMRVGPGRRPVIQKPDGFETVEPSKLYSKKHLIDRKGNPVKWSDIPDRSKGTSGDLL